MFTDMVGYTALGQRDEALSLALVDEQRKLQRPIFTRHGGKEVKTMGDAFLVEFANAMDAVRCAYDVQRASREFNISRPADQRTRLRIGLHLGDVIESQGDISGDAVNIASRIQSLAEEGGVCITRQVYDQVRNKFELSFSSLGTKPLKNVSAPTEVYKMLMPWEKETQAGLGELDVRRVAVLPFANMSPDPNDSYFADGITEEIISTLSGVSGLSVISRTSVMGYKGSSKKVREIGNELEVGSILEGSFRKAGNRVRVTTQLIAVSNDRHVWAQSYDRNLDDVFAVQSDIAKHVSDALKVKILEPESDRIDKKPTGNAKAYSLYLRGRYHWNQRGLDDIKKARDYFQQAVNEDPGFALGYVGLADSDELLADNWNFEPKARHEAAKAMLSKALDIDLNLAEAHATLGLALLHDYDLKGAEEEFKRAIELKPSYATAHQWYFHLLSTESRWEEAFKQIETALELDPLSQVINMNHAEYYIARRDYETALEIIKKALELNPRSEYARFVLAAVYGFMGRLKEMRREIDLGVGLVQPSYPQVAKTSKAMIALMAHDKETLRKLLPELKSHVGEQWYPDAHEIAAYLFELGDLDGGFEWLERSYAQCDFSLLFVLHHRTFDVVRDDPRFQNLLKRLGISS
jgi:TolB-like protein